MRFAAVLASFVFLAAFGLWFVLSGRDTSTQLSNSAVTENGVRDVTPQPGIISASPIVRERVHTVLVVVDASTGRPLPDATLTWIPEGNVEPVLSALADEVVDTAGRARLDPPSGSESLLVRAPGHVPRFVEVVAPGEHRVEMQRSAILTVSVSSVEGAPVADAVIVLTDRTGLDLGDLHMSGIGHPLARNPRWQARSNAAGVALLDEIPPGTLFVNAVHATMFATDDSAYNAAIDLQPGPRRLSFVFREAQAAVFQCPSPHAVEKLDWGVDVTRLAKTPLVTSRLGLVKQELETRFPGSFVYVQCDASEEAEPLIVDCRARTADRSMWSGRWPLTPVSQIAEPVYLELQSGPSRSITIRVVDEQGTEYGGIPLYLIPRPKGSGAPTLGATGERVELTYGRYGVQPTQFQPGVMEALKALEVVVDAKSPDVVSAVIAQPIREVQVDVSYPSDEVLGPLDFYFSNETGGPAVIVNWTPKRGVVKQWMTGGVVSVRVRSVPYRDVDLGPVALKAGEITRLEVRLEEKEKR